MTVTGVKGGFNTLSVESEERAVTLLKVGAKQGNIKRLEAVHAAFPLSNIQRFKSIAELVTTAALYGHTAFVRRVIQLRDVGELDSLFNSALAVAAAADRQTAVLSLLQNVGDAKPLAKHMLSALDYSFESKPLDPVIRKWMLKFCALTTCERERKGYDLIRGVIQADLLDYQEILSERKRGQFEIPSTFVLCAFKAAKCTGNKFAVEQIGKYRREVTALLDFF